MATLLAPADGFLNTQFVAPPVGCLIVARYIYDVLPARRWWLPMLLFFLGLILMRYRLNYY